MKNIDSLSQKIKLIKRNRIEDSRGWFLKTITGLEKGLPNHTGEIYTVYSEKGSPRGGHYHEEATEWFILLVGKSILELKDIKTNELMTVELDANTPITIVVPPSVAHRFDAIDDNSFLLLAYTDVIYDPLDTIAIDF
jgi:dTDP-4-dehydrorhamnose 3,5-epimerase-like enzyme